jgi:CRISPR/Cas system-associated exonuclease Cas4 (RecB family)
MFSVAIELGASGTLSHYRPLPVSADLRGYASERSQIRVEAGTGRLVSITGLSARYCPTGRDIYLEKVLKLDTLSWERSVIGKVVDTILVDLHRIGLEQMDDAFEESVRTGKEVSFTDLETSIATAGENAARTQLLSEWKYAGSDADLKNATLEQFAERIAGKGGADLIAKTLAAIVDLILYETKLLINYLRRCRHGRFGLRYFTNSSLWMAEARAALTRLQTGVKLDDTKKHPTTMFGVSENVRPDFLYAVTLIGDIKTGKYYQFQESVATGYAIFAEFVLTRRINTAFILSIELDLNAGKLRKHRVIRVHVGDQQRQLWITQRDFALKVLRANSVPPHPKDLQPCSDCPYCRHCWERGEPGATPLLTATPLAVPLAGTQ